MLIKAALPLLLFFAQSVQPGAPSIAWHDNTKRALNICFTMPIAEDDALYKEYIDFSCDQEAITITGWSTDSNATSVYDPLFKEHKAVYQKDVTFNINLACNEPLKEAQLRFTYYRKAKGGIQELTLPLRFNHTEALQEVSIETAAETDGIEMKQKDEQPKTTPT